MNAKKMRSERLPMLPMMLKVPLSSRYDEQILSINFVNSCSLDMNVDDEIISGAQNVF